MVGYTYGHLFARVQRDAFFGTLHPQKKMLHPLLYAATGIRFIIWALWIYYILHFELFTSILLGASGIGAFWYGIITTKVAVNVKP
jgi:hypothetical protein